MPTGRRLVRPRLRLILGRTAKQGRAHQLTLCEHPLEALVALLVVVDLAVLGTGVGVLVHGHLF
jgi:hypothetical protein